MKLFKLAFGRFKFNATYISTATDYTKAVALLHNSDAKVFGLDLETGKAGKFREDKLAGLCPHKSFIRLCQIYCPSDNTAYVFDIRKLGGFVNLSELKSLIENRPMVAHYAIFELKHLHGEGVNPKKIHCSKVMAQFVYNAEHSPYEPEEEDDDEESKPADRKYFKKGGFSLDNLVGRYFNLRISKALQVSNWNQRQLTKEQVTYAALDAVLTYELGKTLMPKIVSYEMSAAYSLYRDMMKVVAEMEYYGMYIDQPEHKEQIAKWEAAAKEAKDKCKEFFGAVNLRSTKQLGEWANEYYKDKPRLLAQWPRSEKTGALSFNKTHLADLPTLPPIEALLAYRKYATLLSTFGESLLSKVSKATNRLHGSFILGETRTGRLSSRNPNLQNMPARNDSFRHIFAAPPGAALVVADFSQIEIRVGAELSRDPVMLDAFENGIDLHKKIVSVIGNKPLSKVTKAERQLGKAVNFGLMFGMGPTKLAKYARASYGVEMSEADAEKAWEAYHNLYSTYSAWCNRQRRRAEKVGFARTPLGKMRKLLEGEVYTKAVNTPVQGGAAEVSFQALVYLQRLLEKEDAKIICTVHDEIVVECEAGIAPRVVNYMEQAMTQGLLHVFPGACVNNLVDAHIGTDWAEAKG